MSASKNAGPKRGRGKGRKLSEVAKERLANYDPTSEWVDKYGAAIHLGLGVLGFHKISHWRDKRDLPPAKKQSTGWEWLRSDLSAMEELKRLELWKHWRPLRKEHGELVAWDAMLQLLAEKKAEIKERATDVARRLLNGEAA